MIAGRSVASTAFDRPAQLRLLVFFFVGLIGCSLAPTPASAQLMYLDDIPWMAPADTSSNLAMVVEYNRFTDTKFKWETNRLMLMGLLPTGKYATYFMRIPFVSFDTGQMSVLQRWPWLRGEDATETWPDESRITGIGQPEVGATGPLNLPLIGRSLYGVALGLPAGSDRLYPISSTSLPLRLELKKNLILPRRTYVGLTAGYLMHMDSGDDVLDSSAFPSGVHLAADLARYFGRQNRVVAAWDYHDREGRRSQLVSVQGWFHWTGGGHIGVKVAREIQGTLDRAAEWYFTVAWRIESLPQDDNQTDLSVPPPPGAP